jgi:hypothetical protein
MVAPKAVSMDYLEKLHEIIVVLTAAKSVNSSELRNDICRAAAAALRTVADHMDPVPPPPLPEEDEDISSTTSKHISMYHEFISEMSPSVRRAMPSAPQKERFTVVAALWRKYKKIGILEEIVAAAKMDLPQVPTVGIDLV